MDQLLQYWQSLSSNTVCIVTLVALVILVVIINAILRGVFAWVISAAEHTKTPWDEVLAKAISRPVRTLVWGLALCWAVYLLMNLTGFQGYEKFLYLVAKIFIFAGVVWFLLRFVSFACDYFLKEYEQTKDKDILLIDPASIRAIKKISSIFIFLIAALVLLGILHIPLSGLLTFGGISGAAIAFSAKDMMGNFFGGMLIYFDRPFSVGDWISSPDRQIEGTVEQIGWRLTRIRSFDKRPIYVPNAIFTNSVVVNPSRMTNRRIKQNIGVRYDDIKVLPKILEDVRAMLKNHPEIDQKATTLVNMINFETYGSSSVVFNVYTFTKTTVWVDFQNIQDNVMLKVEEIISANGAEIAFPTRTLKVETQVL